MLKKTLVKAFGVFKKNLKHMATNPQNNSGNHIEVSDFHLKFKFFFDNELEKWRAANFKLKEPETNEWIYNKLKDSSVFWDVGANIGMFSFFAAAANNKCKIYSFEPESLNFACLCKNVYFNSFKNINPLCIGLNNDIPKIMDLFISEMVSGSASHNLGSASGWSAFNHNFKQKVIAMSPDFIVSQFKIPAPTMMKIDVDGIELEILEGASYLLENSIETILVEADANDSAEIKKMHQILSNKKFSLSSQSSRAAQIHNKLPRNFIWTKK